MTEDDKPKAPPEPRKKPPPKRLSPGDSTKVQFRCSRVTHLALLARADAEGITEREAWERAAQEWADR